jgi:hypothetical protein
MTRHQFIRNLTRFVLGLAVAAVTPVISLAGPGPQAMLDLEHPHAKAVIALQQKVTHEMMQLPPVLGTAVGLDDAGRVALVVYVDNGHRAMPEIVEALPAEIDGIPVKAEPTDKFVAFASHTAKQTPPIQLGTSGGWSKDLANGYCCGGTLGSLVQVNGFQYIMSNYHVFESDIVSGGNGIIAQNGDPIIQPGLVDVNCNAAGAQTVATLYKVSSLPSSNVDVSVAQVVSSMVNTSGAILEIGTISKSTVAAALSMGVKKSGRTTGLSSSSISGLNATISVAYENECAGGTAFTKTFTGQIVVANKGSRFLNSGDSGSLMVENVSTNPRAVGLLYAGSSTSAIANPIDQVLQFLSSKLGGTVTMVGN